MRSIFLALPFLLVSCGIYSFSGSSIPAHMKTIEVPLWENGALVQGVAEDVTDAITSRVQKEKLKIVPREGDATISGAITQYSNKAYDYSGDRGNLNVKTYAVDITCKVLFKDNVSAKELYNGTVTGKGIYNFDTENEEIGRKRAVDDLADKIMMNSLQGW